MAYSAYITQLNNVRPHSNADRLQLGDCFGNTVCIDLSYNEGDIGIYFPTDGQLSEEYATKNDLLRRKDANGNNAGGYLDPNKRNIRAIRLRGEKSDGLFMPLRSLEYTGIKISELSVGDRVDVLNGHDICTKYIPRRPRGKDGMTSRTRKNTVPIAPLFAEHVDTAQLAYNLAAFKPGDQVELTLKMHGTSQRTGYLPRLTSYKRTLLDRLLRRKGTPVYDWGYVTGTRRVVLETFDSGYYGSDHFRESHALKFEGKLLKGETAYYEVVGFTDTGIPIMPEGNNKKVQDKDFIKQYGETTTFSYGCSIEDSNLPTSDMYVYRMTMTNEDGDVIEYSPDFMRYRCEQMGVKTVPVFHRFFIPSKNEDPGTYVLNHVERFYDGPDPIGKTHIREGVVARVVNRPTFTAYKHKNYNFKVLEGIIKDSANAPDMEEVQEGEE